MRATPAISEEIRTYTHSKYRNIYELIPDEPRLFGTESMYGDWDGQLLLLAKDFAPSHLVKSRITCRDPRPYRATSKSDPINTPGRTTNINLGELTESIPCEKLYGSAFAGLLRNDNRTSGQLPAFHQIKEEFAKKVISFTIENMQNLKGIACLGKDAWDCATYALGHIGADWKVYRNDRRVLVTDRIKLFALGHPSRHQRTKELTFQEWENMIRELDLAPVPFYPRKQVTRKKESRPFPGGS